MTAMMNLLNRDFANAGGMIRGLWGALSPLPGGKLLFSRALALVNPYTGSMRARILELAPGYARARITEHRRIRNHLRSVHALALMNLAEATSGLALMAGLPDDARGIPIALSIDYLKKARGTITAECHCELPADNRQQELEIAAILSNEAGEEVARARARWRIGPA
jgi:acyl-coenzyme A thioesterase PaaI-like protein